MFWFLNIIAYIVNAVFTFGGGTLGWFGQDITGVSDKYDTLISPDGYAFSIWGLIFAGELVFVIWGAIGDNRSSAVLNEGVSIWFIVACLSQAAWIIAFTLESLILSAVLLCIIATSLAVAVARLSTFKFKQDGIFSSVAFWTVHFPIGLHGGWTLAASLVNITIALDTDNLQTQIAALLLAIVAAALAAAMASVIFYDPIYLAAIAWAIAGIASEQDYRIDRLGEPVADGVTEALNALWIALVCLGVVGVVVFTARRANKEHEPLPQRHRVASGTVDRDLTHAIISS